MNAMNANRLPIWDDYSGSVQAVENPDKIERPPLTGKNRYVPDGLYEEPWDHVNDAYGKATLTPFYIEALTSDDEGDVRFGVYGLESATTHQGSVYKSSQMAIPFLVDLLKFDNDASELACYFLARIALGENHFISAPSGYCQTRYFRSVGKYKKDIKAYYDRTGSDEALRLLCFLPGMLPDYLDTTYKNALALTDGDQGRVCIRQASALIAQGFIAAERNYSEKGYPKYASQIHAESLKVFEHIDETRNLMENSPSLLVRGCAAICLAYTGIVDADILDLFEYLGEKKLNVVWAWDNSFSSITKKAWMYSADLDTLIDSEKFLTPGSTTTTADGVETQHYSAWERLATVAFRIFPEKYTKEGDSLPLLPDELDATQRKLIKKIVEDSPRLLGGFDTSGINLPLNIYSAMRSIEESEEILCTIIEGAPLWFILEKSVFENTPETAAKAHKALKEVDVWKVMQEIYRPVNADHVEEQCTLNLKDYYDNKKTVRREAIIESILADSMAPYVEQIRGFLDEWLVKSRGLKDYDWRFETLGQRIGICLLFLARSGGLCEKYYPLVRPYHLGAMFSSFPIPLLKEVLESTSEEHQAKIEEQFHIHGARGGT